MDKNHPLPGNRKLRFVRLLALASCLSNGAWADEGAMPAIEDLSLNDLMQIEVSSASRKSQTLSNTAAAAFVITQEDIRRSGVTSIPEALRFAPGIEVAQIGASKWAVTSRGFNSLYANKLLVLMDGRTIYTPLFSGVFWDLQDTMMEDIERIEVIRGPGAAMWGANAVNGVINIITKKAKDTLGNLVVAGAGNQERGFAAFRHGGQFSDGGSYRIYGKDFERNATVNAAGQKQNDTWRSGQLGFRMDRSISGDHRLTVQGDTYRKTVNGTTYPLTVLPPFNTTIQANDQASGSNLLARWEGNLSSGSEFTLQAYYDHVRFNAPLLSDTENTLDIDFQHRLHPNETNDLMWGASYRHISSSTGNTSAIAFTPASIGYRNVSVFVQDDIALVADQLRLTLGSKLENSHFGGTQFQPNARILWTPDTRNSVWASISRASRTPSRGEVQSNIALGTMPTGLPAPFNLAQVMSVGNPNLAAEKVTAAEIGYRTQWNDRFSSDITAFSNRYTNLAKFTLGVPALTVPMIWTNSTQAVTTRGLELSADWDALEWMRLIGSYSYLKIGLPADPSNPDTAGLSPRNHGSLRCQMDLNEKSKLDFAVRHVSRLTANNQTVPAYTAFDARFAYAPQPGLELSLAAQNLFSPHHLEYRQSAALTIPALPSEIPRSIYAKLAWSY